MQSTILPHLLSLIRIPSVLGNRAANKETIAYVTRTLKGPGIFLKEYNNEGRPSLMVTFAPNEKKPDVILHGHLDVVPAQHEDQYTPWVKGDRVYGRGAVDMKGGCAVLIALAHTLAAMEKRPRVGFMFVTDEEDSGHFGAGYLLRQGYHPHCFVTIEPTSLAIELEEKGIIRAQIKSTGKGGHGAQPWEAKNTIVELTSALQRIHQQFNIKKDEWKTSCTIAQIHGGRASNIIPDEALATLDIRYVPSDSPKQIEATLKRLCPGLTVTIDFCEPPLQTTKENPWIKQLTKAVTSVTKKPVRFPRAPYATDARFYGAAGIPAAVFGGTGEGMHAAEEWVSLKSLNATYEALLLFTQGLATY